MGEEGLWSAVTEVVKPIIESGRETEYDEEKLSKKVRDYFKKGAKQLEFWSKSFPELANEYADAVYSSLWAGLGERDWLPEVDFLFCLDAGIKESFPQRVAMSVPPAMFEQTVLQAADRASDEQRYFAIRWESIQKIIPTKGTQKKVREILDSARALAVLSKPETIELFAEQWVNNFVRAITKAGWGDPAQVLEEPTAIELFQSLIQDGCLPLALTKLEAPPSAPWPALEALVTQSYASKGGPAPARGRASYGGGASLWGAKPTRATYGTGAAAAGDEPPAKKWKGAGKGKW